MWSSCIFLVITLLKADAYRHETIKWDKIIEPNPVIMVNNVIQPVLSTDLSDKDMNFTVEYQYEEGEEVDVRFFNKYDQAAPLEIEYNLAGMINDKSIMDDLPSTKFIGLITKLYSRHNNSYIICTRNGLNNYTKVLVRFVMLYEFSGIAVLINGVSIRPKLLSEIGSDYYIKYNFQEHTTVEMICINKPTDETMPVSYNNFIKPDSKYFAVLTSDNVTKLSFMPYDFMSMGCEYGHVLVGKRVFIQFTDVGNAWMIDKIRFTMELQPPNGTVLKLYIDPYTRVILYEFQVGQTLNLSCVNTNVDHYLVIKGSDFKIDCSKTECSIVKTFHKHENSEITCWQDRYYGYETRAIFRERFLYSTIASMTSTIASAPIAPPIIINSSRYLLLYYLLPVAVAAVFIILLVLYYKTIKKWCCGSSSLPIPAPRSNPEAVFYVNLLSVFKPINEREAAELEENQYEEIM